MSSLVLTVVYTGEPDVVHEFTEDGMRRTFGRDEDRCDIVIWSAINDRSLSRTAGVIWRMDDQLWVRNLSTRHEVTVQDPQRPAEAPLPPRMDDGFDRGPARAIPAGHTFVRGPSGCELLVRQLWPLSAPGVEARSELATVQLPTLPAELLLVALALCEPILRGRMVAPPYALVAQRLGCTAKQARTAVNRLTAHYAEHVPALQRGMQARERREQAALALAGRPLLRKGVWTFHAPASMSGTSADDGVDVAQDPLALPAYQEVAHFMVLRGVVRAKDLHQLDGTTG